MPPAIQCFLKITSVLLVYFIASDYFWNRYSTNNKKYWQYLTGIMQGVIGIWLIANKVVWMEYCTSLDARAVILCITGLLFGRIPAITSAAIMSLFTIYYEDNIDNMLSQLAYTVAITVVSLTFLNKNPRWQKGNYYKTIILCTISCQAILTAALMIPPCPDRMAMLKEILLPVWLLMPISNLGISRLLLSRVLNGELQKELMLSEERFKRIALCSNDSFWELDTSGIIKYVTGNTKDTFGYSNEELIGTMPHTFISDSKSMNILLEFTSSTEERVFDSELTFKHKRGYNVYCNSRGIKILDENGHISGYIGILHNITEQHLHEVLMRNNEKLMREQNSEFRRLNEELRGNNKQIRNANEQLKEANKKVRESQETQFSFLANIGHELLMPIEDIEKWTEQINDPSTTPEQRNTFLKQTKSNCKFMRSLISDITDTDIINKGLMKIKFTIGNVDELMTDLYEYHYYKNIYVDKKPIYLKSTTDLSSDERIIRTDFVRLRQILSNLINNSFNFTNSGKIWVRCQKLNDSELQFSVSDNGMGIPESAYPHIFTPYNHSTSYKVKHSVLEHTGLGLGICKSLVEMMGGRIWFESEMGKGTTFYFTIPYLKASEAMAETTTNYDWSKFSLLVAGCDRYNNVLICNKILSTGARFCNFVIHPDDKSKTSLDTSYYRKISLMIVDERVLQQPCVIDLLTRYPSAPVIITGETIKTNELCREIDQKLNAIA